jgi:hyaluronate lyase
MIPTPTAQPTVAAREPQEAKMTPASTSLTNDNFARVRARWRSLLTLGPSPRPSDPDVIAGLERQAATARRFWSSLQTSADRAFLWPDLANPSEPGQVAESYNRLRVLALAYATPGSSLQNAPKLKADLLGALDWLSANGYNEQKTKVGNWWYWEIGIPLALNDIVILLNEALSADQISQFMGAIDHFTPVVKYTGANLVWLATIIAIRAAIVESDQKLVAARDGLSPVFRYITSGDGFYADGSFIQHEAHPYNGGYGAALLANLSSLLYALTGSPWQVKDPNQRNVFHWIYDSFEPLIYKGAMMDLVRGREIARTTNSDHASGHGVIGSILLLSEIAPPADAAAFKSMVKGWIQADQYRDFLKTAPVPMLGLAKTVREDPSVTPPSAPVRHQAYPSMDRIVHRRPSYAFAISMSSQRIFNYESINQENLHGWYTGDGMTYLYNEDLAQYADGFWPTVDPYRLPGTTVAAVKRADDSGTNYRSPSTWTGGAVLLDRFGATGMDLRAWNDLVSAKKSWFSFDDEIVALGAGISSSTPDPVETIVENRRLTSWSELLARPTWLHLEGTGGYYFPVPTSIHALREARTGVWYDIDHLYGAKTSLSRVYLTLWIDHGINPASASYAYVLLPNQTAEATQKYASKPPIQILENSAKVQAVRHLGLGILAANFWEDTVHQVDVLTSDRAASVLLRETTASNGESVLDLAIADPTQANDGTITIEIARSAGQVLATDPGLAVSQLSPTIRLVVAVKEARGKTFQARLQVAKS